MYSFIISQAKTNSLEIQRRQPSNLYNQRGFTMIELLVVLVVTAVLVAIAFPDFISTTRGLQTAHVAREMSGAIKFTRAEAIRRGQLVVMCRANSTQTSCDTSSSSNWKNGWLVFTDLNDNKQLDSGETLIAVRQTMSNGTDAFVHTGGTPINKYIVFNPAGELAANFANAGTITFTKDNDGNAQHVLVMDAVGRVRTMTYDQCSNWPQKCNELP